MTVEDLDDEPEAGPSGAQPIPPRTPNLGFEYFNKEMCLAPSKKQRNPRVELCTTVLPVLESPLSPPAHERGPSLDTPLVQSTAGGFYASYHLQNTRPYQNESENLHTGCMVCGKSTDQIMQEKSIGTCRDRRRIVNPPISLLFAVKPTQMVLTPAICSS